MANSPSFMIIEDHPLVRDALEARLRDAFADGDIVYSGASLTQATAVAATRPVDCAILDLDLGDGRSPVLNTSDLVESGCKVLVVSALADPATVRCALQAGALGFVSKQTPTTELLKAVTDTLAGEASTSRDVASMLCADDAPGTMLSDRERTAMVLYASGMKIEMVARRMGIKPTTAGEYIKRVREKYLRAGTPIPTKTEMYRRAREDGLVP